jgi:hypothetical protein
VRRAFAAWESMLSSRIDGRPYLWFRRLFVLKLAAFATLTLWLRLPGSAPFLLLVLVSAGQAVFARTRYLPGLLGMLAYEVWNVTQTFPFTLNHHFFETAVLLIMVVSPAEHSRGPADEAGLVYIDARAVRLIQLAVISVWAYAAIQKIVHEQYWNGELFGLYGLYEGGRFVSVTERFASLVSHVAGAEVAALPLTWSASLAPQPVAAPAWLCASFVWLGRSTIVLELTIALGLLFHRTRTAAVTGLMAFQTVIALITGEISFGLAGQVSAVLFLPYTPILYGVVALVVAAGVVVTGLGVL